MESELQRRLNNILAEKEEKLKPQNLRQGVTFLGVTGTLEQKEDLDNELTIQTRKIAAQKEEINDLIAQLDDKINPDNIDRELNAQDNALINVEASIEQIKQILTIKYKG